jgi:hypothetical protein
MRSLRMRPSSRVLAIAAILAVIAISSANTWHQFLGLFRGTKLHPELPFLMPSRPPNATDCPDCRGTGKLAFPEVAKHLVETVIFSCGGIGWLPPDTE